MAGYIPDDIVEKIKSDTDILDLIGEYVNLKRAGKDYLGLCPFHREKTPSFTVVPAKEFYYCFGCGASGNAVNFIMRHENIDYPDALRFLAKRAGITIPETGFPDSGTNRLYKACEYAGNLFRRHIRNSIAYDYIKMRGISDEIISELEIGYAPAGWDNLHKAFINDKLSPADFEKAGLIVKSDKHAGFYDKFRNRLIFPIKNISGRVIGFGGRALSDEEGPKYLNSPESQIYHKGSVLYGLNWAKNDIRNSGKAIITEGYFDYASLYQAGIKNIVAVSGTGFTPNQGSLLARFCSEIVLLYDADSAGLKATFRAVDVLYNSGLEPYVVRLPKGKDPDEFIKNFGADELRKLIDSAIGYVDFIKQSLPDKFGRLTISRQEKIIKSLAETAANIEDSLKHELFVRKAMETLDLPSSAAAKFTKSTGAQAQQQTTSIAGRDRLEMNFLGFLFANPEYIKESLQVVKPELINEPVNREIFNKLKTVSSSKFSVGEFLEQFSDEGIRRRITKIIVNESSDAPADVWFSKYLEKFKYYQLSDKLNSIQSEMAKAEKEGDLENAEKLIREYQELQNVANRKVV